MAGRSLRGIRGAITVDRNEAAEIAAATRELIEAITTKNSLDTEDIASAIFTVTPDLDAGFPATAAREMGWQYIPLLCANEINVPGSLGKCIRVLIHVNTEKSQKELKHVYLRGAAVLREDLNLL
ncbi:chorismate mutase [Pelotomaculum propionicicum]|uniref:chorismate mutase n=1 Tax=Pelotomaculum propionicicum TaxID=258475 RepID=A0A4Y7RT33_9FIRM|nr:chorismate mutase [Pelotomaculum propionicicum]NLI11186.1 chorismate mutase [Peptococcaceae bacterium]TEB11832.1 Chorismate mutase AroH [Pelotomaculum propionicicum]